jgi:hypothetical protein
MIGPGHQKAKLVKILLGERGNNSSIHGLHQGLFGPGFQRNFISHKEGLGQMASPVPQFLACIFPKFMNKYN